MNPENQSSLSTWEQEIIQYGYSQQMPMNDNGFTPIGGDMGMDCEDFDVTEIPAYLPSGTGEHIYLKNKKKDHSTHDVIRTLEKVFQVKETAIGYAGKKDAKAVTRQWMSIQTHISDEQIQSCLEQLLRFDWMKVLKVSKHNNKLRLGHLTGNHFKIRLNHVQADDRIIETACNKLNQSGFINYFGRQRFGFDKSNIEHGLRIMAGEKARHQQKLMCISAIQSALFNLAAARRFKSVGFQVLTGDVMRKINAGCFVCDDPVTDQKRANDREIAVTVSLPGKKVIHGNGFSEETELQAITDFTDFWKQNNANTCSDFSNLTKLADGDRRQLWVFPENLTFRRIDNQSIEVDFSLPSGSYATILLRHLCGLSFTR